MASSRPIPLLAPTTIVVLEVMFEGSRIAKMKVCLYIYVNGVDALIFTDAEWNVGSEHVSRAGGRLPLIIFPLIDKLGEPTIHNSVVKHFYSLLCHKPLRPTRLSSMRTAEVKMPRAPAT